MTGLVRSVHLRNSMARLAHSRFAFYDAWRSVRDRLLDSYRTKRPPTSLGAIVTQAEQVTSDHLTAEHATKMSDAMGVLGGLDGMPGVDAVLASLATIHTVLGEIAISNPADRTYTFAAEDALPIDDEEVVLTTALQIDEDLYNGEQLQVQELSTAARIDLVIVRRVLCRWLDEDVAYMHASVLDFQSGEDFLLTPRAELRQERWAEYSEKRRMARIAKLQIDVVDLPPDYRDLARGIGDEHEITVMQADPSSRGVLVTAETSTSWDVDETKKRLSAFVDALKAALARSAAKVPAATVVSHHYHAGQVAAQGPNATASGNVMVQHVEQTWTTGDQERALEELVTLRKELAAHIADAQDAIEIGHIGQAEDAAKRGDRAGVFGALKRLARKTWDVVERLGLQWLQLQSRTHLGLPPAGPSE